MLDKGEKPGIQVKGSKGYSIRDIKEKGRNSYVMDLGFVGVVQCSKEAKGLNEHET